MNLFDSNPLLSSATADIFAPCRGIAPMLSFVNDVVAQDVESGTTGTDESQWFAVSSDSAFLEAVEEVVAPCKEAISMASASTSSTE